MTTTVSRAIPSQSVGTATERVPVALLRPPTLFARHSPDELVRAGHDLARRAAGYSLKKVPFDDAVSRLLESEPARDALRVAQDLLAFGRLDVPLVAQVDAEFLVENAIHRLEHLHRRRARRLLRK